MCIAAAVADIFSASCSDGRPYWGTHIGADKQVALYKRASVRSDDFSTSRLG